jgi:hypothetical protein
MVRAARSPVALAALAFPYTPTKVRYVRDACG